MHTHTVEKKQIN